MSVQREQRHTRAHPCPACGGGEDMPRGKEVRCAGFTSPDGEWVWCERMGAAEGAELDEECSPPAYKWKRCENGTYRPWTKEPLSTAIYTSIPRSEAYRASRGHSVMGKGDSIPPVALHGKTHPRTAGVRYFPYTDTQRVRREDYQEKDKTTGAPIWEKRIRPEHLAGRQWHTGEGPEPIARVYRAEDLTDPTRRENTVLVCEGEATADVLRAANFLAVTWRGGTGRTAKAMPQLMEALAGREVVLWPDADAPGRDAMRRIGDALAPVAARVQWFDPYGPDDLSKRDADDWLHERGGDGDALAAILEDAPDYTLPPHNESGVTGADALPPSFTLKQLMAKEIPPRYEPVPGLISEGVTLFVGKAKLGKSWLLYNLALALAWGGVALGKIAVDRCDVLLLALEDGEARLQRRFETLLRDREPPDGLHIFTQWPRLDAGGGTQLDAYLAAHPAVKVVFIDTLAKVRPARKRGGDLYAEDYAVGEMLKAIAERHHVAIVVVHHSRKAGGEDFVDEVSGTTGLTGGVDAILLLRRDRGKADAVLCVSGRDVEEAEHALTWEAILAQWTIAGNAEDFRRSQIRQDILAALTAAGEPLTPSGVAERTGQSVNTIKQRMWQMAKDGDLYAEGGKYTIPAQMHNRITAITGGPETPAPQGEPAVMAPEGVHNRITGGITGDTLAVPKQAGGNDGNGYAVMPVMAVNRDEMDVPMSAFAGEESPR